MTKRILSISYDSSLLLTRQLLLQQMGHEVVPAEGFARAWDICAERDGQFDLIILCHSIPHTDKEAIIAHIAKACTAPVLALMRPHEGSVRGATRSLDASNPLDFLAAVREMLSK